MRRRKASPKSQRAPKGPSRRRVGRNTENRSTHSQAAQGVTQEGPACCRGSSPKNEGLVLTVSSGLVLALVPSEGYLSTCISIVKEIQTRSRLFMILCLIVIAAIAGAYYRTSLSVWMLWAKVLLEQSVGQLKSVWNSLDFCRNSLALLDKQVQEVQQLRKEVACLVAEMSHVKKELQDMRMAMSALPLEENVRMSAWVLKSAGVTIDLQRAPRSYAWPCSVLSFLCDPNPVDTFVQLDISPGYCWPFQAFRSQVVIRLPAEVRPTAITVQHPLKKSSALGDVSSAPRDFTVSGVDEEGKEETLLGMFCYDIEKEPTQTFPLQNELPRAFRLIRLVIQSNWGKSGYTCIYRVQVHGKIM